MGKRVGVLLAGCGHRDGAEVHEATLSLYFLDKAGAEIVAMAPDKLQADVIDHVTGKPMAGERNVLVESARISRGNIRDVATVTASELDALVIPGGFGAAKNVVTFAQEGVDCSVDDGAARLIRELHAQKKPIAALCIAPMVLARVLGADHHVTLTIGDDPSTKDALETLGARHVARMATDIAIDEENKVLSTPCYMLAKGPAEVGAGIDKLVTKLMSWL
ncbi:MAG: isoprenoid biosynthesis glyoxalase ElbB [Myxococcales bacterium]|nr:isoprenoid biosynthesis glyoxalase ElbB [Myxococcales bacterium]